MVDTFIPTDDGRWVNSTYERLARVINDYDENLQLCWIPPDKRTREDKKPYMILDIKTQSPIFYASELDTPVDILTRLYAADAKHGDVHEKLVAHNLAVEIMENQQWEDEREELRSQANFLLGSPLNTVKFKGRKLDHLRRPIL